MAALAVLRITYSLRSSASCTITSAPRPMKTWRRIDRKSTRLNSSHGYISYAVLCLEKNLVAGGISASITALASLEDYNSVTGRWRLLDGSLHFARYSQTTVTLLDGNLLIAGGGASA